MLLRRGDGGGAAHVLLFRHIAWLRYLGLGWRASTCISRPLTGATCISQPLAGVSLCHTRAANLPNCSHTRDPSRPRTSHALLLLLLVADPAGRSRHGWNSSGEVTPAIGIPFHPVLCALESWSHANAHAPPRVCLHLCAMHACCEIICCAHHMKPSSCTVPSTLSTSAYFALSPTHPCMLLPQYNPGCRTGLPRRREPSCHGGPGHRPADISGDADGQRQAHRRSGVQ